MSHRQPLGSQLRQYPARYAEAGVEPVQGVDDAAGFGGELRFHRRGRWEGVPYGGWL
ncbi:hypothetical protein [Streptomyces sp. MZ04]|uniref:hypothetical protein n=1 Tax=Streptomyces sp. MZ04 TaxID=2559236 RepID=UPI0014329D50|nr:hypothetical protein [Streptomyces sp. MZ04]